MLLDGNGEAHAPGTIARTKIATYRVVDGADTTDYPASEIDKYDSSTDTLYSKSSINPFLNKTNLVLVTKDASFFAIIAVGMTGVIILAGIDLSVGSIYGLSAVVGAMALQSLPADVGWFVAVPVGVLVCMSVGTVCGLANGSMSEGLGVHPFVITLGMMAALRGLTVVLPQELFGTQSIGGFPDSFSKGFFKAEFYGVYPVPVIIMILSGIAGWFVLSKTVFGRRVFAIGGNETAAKYAGIPVKRTKILVYTITGALWGAPTWGTWWVWDPKLTSVLIMFFFYVGYIGLWNAVDDPDKAAELTAWLCLVGVIFAIMSRYAVEIFDGRTLHQPASVSLDEEENIGNAIYFPLLFTIFGFFFAFLALMLAQTRTEIRRRRARALAMQAARV